MSNDARLSTSFPSHPKTKKLIRRVGEAGAWFLVRLILWAASNRSDGDLSGMTDEDIELAVDWTGEDGAFVRALAEVGFLDGAECERVIHDWEDHNPWVAGSERRSEKSRWAALCKQHGRSEAARAMPEYAKRIGFHPAAHATGTPVAVPKPATGMPLAESGTAPSPSPSPSPISKPDGFEGERSRARHPPPDPGPPPPDAPTGRATKPATRRNQVLPRPDDVEPQTWADWLALRRAKRAPVNDTVLAGARAEASKAGMAMEAWLREWCVRGSQGLKADWVLANRQAAGRPPARASPPVESFRERDERLAAERYASLTGRADASPTAATGCIDVTAKVIDIDLKRIAS